MNRIILITILVLAIPTALCAQINWTEHVVDGEFGTAYSVYAADVDDDGDIDVLGAAYGDDEITWWENTNGIGTSWTEHLVDSTFDNAYSVYAAEVNDDEDMDILGAAYIGNDITWWENLDGSGTSWAKHAIDSDFGHASSVFAADINDDDYIDVLGAGSQVDEITWWENTDGTGTNWTEHTIDGDFDGSRSVYAADIDGDGDMDVLGAAINDNDITWWESDLVIIDVGVLSINVDTLIPEGTTINPEATVKNFGTDSTSFNVTCEIDPGAYVSSETVTDLPPNDTIPVIFGPEFIFTGGSCTLTVCTQLEGDQNPTNDCITVVIKTYPGVAEGGSVIPVTFMLNATTISKGEHKIEFTLPKATKIDLLVYDAIGRLRRTIVSDRFSAGIHSLNVNLELPAGVYFYNLKTESGIITKKFLVVE